MHHRGEQHHPFAGPGEVWEPSVAVEFAQQVGRCAGDHLGRTGGAGAELYHGVRGPGRTSAGPLFDHRIHLGEAAQPGRGVPIRPDQYLWLQSDQRGLDLVLGEAVVQQHHLRALLPTGQQGDHVGQRGRQPQCQRAAGGQARGGEPGTLLGHQGAQGAAMGRGPELDALLLLLACQQEEFDPVLRYVRRRGRGETGQRHSTHQGGNHGRRFELNAVNSACRPWHRRIVKSRSIPMWPIPSTLPIQDWPERGRPRRSVSVGPLSPAEAAGYRGAGADRRRAARGPVAAGRPEWPHRAGGGARGQPGPVRGWPPATAGPRARRRRRRCCGPKGTRSWRCWGVPDWVISIGVRSPAAAKKCERSTDIQKRTCICQNCRLHFRDGTGTTPIASPDNSTTSARK